MACFSITLAHGSVPSVAITTSNPMLISYQMTQVLVSDVSAEIGLMIL
jgi:hypothetical protein